VPIGAAAFLISLRTVRESVSEEERLLDIPGLLLGTGALFCVTYALIEANQRGWTDPIIIGGFVGFVLLGAAFLMWEIRNEHAMMPLRFFRIPAFSAGNTVAFCVSLGMFAVLFFFSIYLQSLHGYTPFQAGVRFLPLTLAVIITAPNAGKFAQRHGSRVPMTYGLLLAGGGLLLLGLTIKIDTPYWYLFPVFAVMGHGIGATMAPMTAAVMNSVGPQRAGLGSAMTNTSREIGGVLGIALLGAILTTELKNAFLPALDRFGLSPAQQAAIGTAAGRGEFGPALLRGLPSAVQAGIGQAFGNAFMDGFRLALLVGGSVLLAGAIVAFTWIPQGGYRREDAGGAEREEPIPVEV
jgi:MFS family permease